MTGAHFMNLAIGVHYFHTNFLTFNWSEDMKTLNPMPEHGKGLSDLQIYI